MNNNTNNQKIISVVIPAYNVSKYIKQSLYSVISQTYKNLEIIVVNDGATDNTGEIINEYANKDDRIIIINQDNQGLAAARNTGLRSAKGEYICLLDSDDIMFPDKIFKQYRFLESHPEYDIAYSDLYHFMDGKTTVYHHPIAKLSVPQYDSLLYGNIINPNTVFFRKSILKNHGLFDESIKSAEDWEYFLNLSLNNINFGYQSETLTLYRVRGNSLSSNLIIMSITSIEVLKKQLNKKINETQKTIIESRLINWNKILYIAYLKSGDKNKAKKIKNHIVNSKLFFNIIFMIPTLFFKIHHSINKTVKFRSNYIKVDNKYVENYLKTVESYGKI